MTIRLLCYSGDRPCRDDRCHRCHGYGAVTVRGWRRWLIAKLMGV